MDYGRIRVRLLNGLSRAFAGAVSVAGGLIAVSDRALRRVDAWAASARDALLASAHINPSALTGRALLAASPGWLRRPFDLAATWLSPVLESFGRALAFLPKESGWRRAATGTAMLVGVVLLTSVTGPPEAKPFPGGWRPLIIGYFENGWSEVFGDSFPALQRHAEQIDIVMPFWYSIHPSGDIEDRGARPEVVEFAHSQGMLVAPLVNNAKIGTTAAFLVDPAAREEAARVLRRIVDEMGYDGVHMDFERIPARWREEYTSFIAEIKAALGPGKHLSVAVFPQVDVPEAISGAHDYAALAGLSDFIVLMGYDRHWAGGTPGPVSPYDWIERNINYALFDQGVPADKLALAVGGYGYDWPRGGGRATVVPSRLAPSLAARRGATVEFDSESRNPHFTYYDGSVRHDVWFQDERVMAQRIAQAREHKLIGLAIWRLGYETPQTWTVLRGEVGLRAGPGR